MARLPSPTWIASILAVTLIVAAPAGPALGVDAPTPRLIKGGDPVDWWFVFKFNSSESFAGCVARRKQDDAHAASEDRKCPFGGKLQTKVSFGQQFAFASSKNSELVAGKGCAGATEQDPIAATFEQVYKGEFHYLIWNDQFYRDPAVRACKGDSCGAPWGHSKGLLAWNDAGDGFVMQVSTPAWPRSGSDDFDKRRVNKGNTLGCNSSNNNLRASQHFFAVKLKEDGIIKVLDALYNASVVTDPGQLQIVRNGGPAEIQQRVKKLGVRAKPEEEQIMVVPLSGKITLISKPSGLHVPPWQMVSSLLDSAKNQKQSNAAERTATWWTKPWIPTTVKDTNVRCWDDEWAADDKHQGKGKLPTRKPGPVAIVMTGSWEDHTIKLTAPSNHAKIGTAIAGDKKYAIFGDLNQQGGISPPACDKSQNARGGLFFAVHDDTLFDSIKDLIDGKVAPLKAPSK